MKNSIDSPEFSLCCLFNGKWGMNKFDDMNVGRTVILGYENRRNGAFVDFFHNGSRAFRIRQ